MVDLCPYLLGVYSVLFWWFGGRRIHGSQWNWEELMRVSKQSKILLCFLMLVIALRFFFLFSWTSNFGINCYFSLLVFSYQNTVKSGDTSLRQNIISISMLWNVILALCNLPWKMPKTDSSLLFLVFIFLICSIYVFLGAGWGPRSCKSLSWVFCESP